MSRTTGRSVSDWPTNLPAELTPFLGRERELGELSRLVHDTRLLSLLGPAGIGKTRLALRLASTLKRRFPAGAWLIQLSAVGDGALLPTVVAGALGIHEARSGDTLAVVDAAIGTREILLILDNCEHLVDRVAPVLEHLLRTCPGLTVLATSRERLGAIGELAWRVPPMEIPQAERDYTPGELEEVEAVALFAERARRANAHFAITPANVGDVTELVCRLDGLPLAVELAAGWMETLSPAEFARELDQRHQMLVARSRVANERHTSLWAAIDSSHERLEGTSREMFHQLAVFAGGWNLGAMTAVCRLESGPAVEVLGRLVDHSFVTVVPTTSGPTRYRLLNVLRRYALSKLEESGRRDDTERRFAEHMVGLTESAAPELTRREGPRWLGVIDAELDNLRAVLAADAPWAPALQLRLAVALTSYWHFRGLFDEGRRNLAEVLGGPRAATGATVAARVGLSRLCWAQGELDAAARHARIAISDARRIGDQRAAAFALLRLAQARFDTARPASAGRATERAAEIAREIGHEWLLAECILQLGQVALVEGREVDADRLLSEGVRLLSQTGQVDREAIALQVLGRFYLQQGRTGEAETALLSSMSALREFELVRHSVPMLEALAAVAADRGDHPRAARLAGAAEGLLERMGARPPRNAPMRSAVVAHWQPSLTAPGADRAFAEGRRMELRDAIALALGDAPAAPSRRPRQEPARPALTRRQMEVAALIAQAMSNREIGARLGLSERTVEGHVAQLCNKLGFNSRVQITAWVVRRDAQD